MFSKLGNRNRILFNGNSLKNKFSGWGYNSVVKDLFHMHEAVGSIFSKKGKTNKQTNQTTKLKLYNKGVGRSLVSETVKTVPLLLFSFFNSHELLTSSNQQETLTLH